MVQPNPSRFNIKLENRTIRVLIVASTFPAHSQDGVPRFIYELASRLAQQMPVTVLTQHVPGAALRETIDGMEIVRFRYAPERFELLSAFGGITNSLKVKPLLWLTVPLFLLSQTIAIFRLLRNEHFDLINAHWFLPQGASVRLAKILCRSYRPLIVTGHGADIYALQGTLLNMIKRWISKGCNKVTLVSTAMEEFVVKNRISQPEIIKVVPMGTDLINTFKPSDLPRESGQILFVGRLVEKKGLRYLIEAFPKILQRIPEGRLLIAGDGPERDELIQLIDSLGIRDQVVLLGSVGHKDLVNLYQTSEMCVLPFVQADDGDMEGLGLVTVEAMGCHCPVVVGDVPAVHDVVTDRQTGWICDPTSEQSLVETILELHREKKTREKMAQNGRNYVLEHFDWKITIGRLTDIFHSAVN